MPAFNDDFAVGHLLNSIYLFIQMNPFIYFCLYQKDNYDLQAKYNLSVFNILGYLDWNMHS